MNRTRITFFFVWSIAFLIITLVGFIPTFLARPLFRETSLPLYLIVHGIIMLLWFSGYFFQNLLVARGQIVNHRKFGMYWFALTILMAIANLFVVSKISTELATGTPTYFGEIRTVANSGGLIIGNLFITIFSSILILFAYLRRFKPKVHKRAIFGASFFLLTPAFDRFIRPFGLPEIFQFVGSFIIPISLVAYEVIRYKKIHSMTWVIVAITLLMIPTLMTILNNESLLKSIIDFLV